MATFSPQEVQYEYAHADQSNQAGLVAVSVIFTALAALILVLRIFCRWLMRLPLWWDDITIVLALVSSTHSISRAALTGLGCRPSMHGVRFAGRAMGAGPT